MTVSSTISVFCRDGVFRTVYCHLHGEPTWNGRILHTHYATGQLAEALVEHGDIRCLGPRCDKPAGHTLQNPVDGVTAYYGRDSGFRMDSEAREYRSFREAIATESTEEVRFHYVHRRLLEGDVPHAGRLEDESARAGTASLSEMKKGRAINPASLRRYFPARKSGSHQQHKEKYL